MDKKTRNLYLIHLVVPGLTIIVYLLFLSYMHLFAAISILIALEIILNMRYPLADFKRYYLVNALGVFIFMSIFILWHKNMSSFERHWLLTYNGILVVILAPLLGYALRKTLLEKKQTIYLARILVPGMILALVDVVTKGSVTGGVMLIVLLIVISWQIVSSVGITKASLWKFYLADIAGLTLFIIIFTYEEFIRMSLPQWIDHNKGGFIYILGIPLIGLLGGWIISNVNFKPIDDDHRDNQHEQSNPKEEE